MSGLWKSGDPCRECLVLLLRKPQCCCLAFQSCCLGCLEYLACFWVEPCLFETCESRPGCKMFEEGKWLQDDASERALKSRSAVNCGTVRNPTCSGRDPLASRSTSCQPIEAWPNPANGSPGLHERVHPPLRNSTSTALWSMSNPLRGPAIECDTAGFFLDFLNRLWNANAVDPSV